MSSKFNPSISGNYRSHRPDLTFNNNRDLPGQGNNLSYMNTMNRSFNTPLSIPNLNQGPCPRGMYHNSAQPPPLPPRPDVSSSFMRPPMRSYYSPYSALSSNMYSPFRSFGNYSPYNSHHDPYNSFIQLAEESSRSTFETIESVVQVFSSVSMMLESTYQAVYSSYSAILGVVDQFSRLKDHIAEVLSILTLLRGLRWLCLKILYLLRLRKHDPSETAWMSAKTAGGSPSRNYGSQRSSMPFIVFLGIVFGAPWLMYKLLAKTIKKSTEPKYWITAEGKQYFGETAYDFKASSSKELSFSAGETLILCPDDFCGSRPKPWLRACNKKAKIGLIPSNYLANIKTWRKNNSAQKAEAQGATNPVPVVGNPVSSLDNSSDDADPGVSETNDQSVANNSQNCECVNTTENNTSSESNAPPVSEDENDAKKI